MDDEPKIIKVVKLQCLASPIGADPRTHLYEIEYEYYDNGVVKMVAGTLKDLGPIDKKDKATNK
ncbi:MAG: hypothetical protein M1334_03760 [Patescibacteria group bacterium]|nr:hypothetical protein [Patescibacteria group bacterium]